MTFKINSATHATVKRMVACVAVVSVSFRPSGSSARGHLAKRSKKSRSGREGRGRKGKVPFPSPPLPPAGEGKERFPFLPRPSPTLLLFLLLFAKCPRALDPLGLKETETTATQAIPVRAKLLFRLNTHMRVAQACQPPLFL